MSQFIIKISDINKCLSAFQDIDMQMKDQIESLSKVKQSISAVKGFEYFLEQISVIEKQMHSERKGVIGLKKALGDIVAEYINTEEAILNKGTVEIDIEKSYAKAGENAGCLSHIFSRYFKLIKELSDNNPTINANEEFVAYLQSEYGFDQKTSEYMLDLYNRIKANNPKDTHEEIDWKFSRAISQMGGYNNKPVSFGPFSIETDAWKKGAGIVYGYKDEKKYFCDTLGMDEAEYKYLRQMVRLQHFMTSDADIYGADAVKKMYNNGSPTDEFNSWKETYNNATGQALSDEEYVKEYEKLYNRMKETGDYSHFMYTVSSNILDKGHGVKNNWTNMGARETSWSNAEERKDIVGWLGDAVYDGSENQVSFGESDYIADVDADNIAYRYDNKTSDERLIDVMKDYYEDIDENPDKIRTQEFVENNSYDSIESSILDIVGDVNHDGKKDIGDLNNPTYKETKAFLNRLKRLR